MTKDEINQNAEDFSFVTGKKTDELLMTKETKHTMYVILRLEDAKTLASAAAKTPISGNTENIIERIQAEAGADIEDIVRHLKEVGPCHACVVEGQERSCECWVVNRQGRRLSRLVDRANSCEQALKLGERYD